MNQVLPPFFIGIAGLGLGAAIYAFWQSVRGLLQAEPDGPALGAGSETRFALIDEKATLLKAIKELQFERDIGKISDQDYEALNARYRARAKQVLRDLDRQLGPHRKQAAAVVERQLKGTPAAPGGDGPAQAGRAAAPAETPAAVAEQAQGPGTAGAGEASGRASCAGCGASNEADAAFCKKCGQAMAGNKAQ